MISSSELDAITARLGSISPTMKDRIATVSPSVARLLDDMRRLLDYIDELENDDY